MRLITRADFDGLVCGAILMELGIIETWKFVHPKDLQDGKVEITEYDILANVPFVKGCGLWFDHHASENERIGEEIIFDGLSHEADSAARIVYEYYGGIAELPHLNDMITAVDKVDSGKLAIEDILTPKNWVLLGFILDPRTGIGRHEFSKGHWEFIESLMEDFCNYTIDELIMLPDVAERVEFYHKQNNKFKEMIEQHTTTNQNIIITDLRGVDTIHTGNRFLIYSLYPQQNISIWIVDGLQGFVTFAVGHSIINRTSNVDVGHIMLELGGGGHVKVGTCQVPHEKADETCETIINRILQEN